MRFAKLNGNRIEACPGAQGFCAECGSELIAKCGAVRVWHWAHKGRRHCDTWWENETEWHREWKNKFPVKWQEISARDNQGELHIADIKTPKGVVVEFQHSYIKPVEAYKRTDFHKPMIWVIDGTRRKSDWIQFKEEIDDGPKHPTRDGLVYEPWIENVRLLKEWAGLGVFIAFDFGAENIWLLSRVRGARVLMFEYSKEKLVDDIKEGTLPRVLIGQPQRIVAQPSRLRRRGYPRF